MRLTFNGAAREVTGSNFLLEVEGQKALIDCGLKQGGAYFEKQNWDDFPYNPKEISAVLVTHPHIDHVGRIPKLYKEGFRGKVYSTPPVKDFAELLLLDSEHILLQDAEKYKKPALYGVREVEELMAGHWEVFDYHQPFRVGALTATFYNAGHILGSAFIVVEAGGKKVAFSGDLGNSPAPIIGKREELPEGVDYALMEATYGNRVHEPAADRALMLEKAIEETAKSGGVLMIPSFAMERTQQLLYELNDLVENKRVPQMPIYLDSPLAIKLTDVYNKHERYWDKKAMEQLKRGDALFSFPGLKRTLTTEESKSINDISPPKVVIAGAGMSNAGRILHHEQRYLPDPKSLLFIVGYQANGSLGRQILDGKRSGKPFSVKIHGETVPVNARVAAVGAFSAHADRPQLLDWIRPAAENLKKIFLVHGEEDQMAPLARRIKKEFGIDVFLPEPGNVVEL